MPLRFDWITIINIVGAVNGLFFSVIILGVKKGNPQINRVLAALIVALTFVIAASVCLNTNLYYTYPHLFGIFPLVYYALGPLLFFYITALTSPRFTFKNIYFLHFVPLLLVAVLRIPFYLQNAAYKANSFKQAMSQTGAGLHLMPVLRFIHMGIYLVLAWLALREHNRAIKNTHSSTERIRLQWLYNLVIAFSTVLISYILFYLFWFYGATPATPVSRVLSMWETALVFVLGYKGLVQPEIFSREETADKIPKYKDSSLSDSQAEEYRVKLLKHMNREKSFTRFDLTLKDLAEDLSISPRHLSQVINERTGGNFYEFVNRFRIEEAQRYLRHPGKKSMTILEIAYESGFNSKTAFYEFFKKHTRMTPTQYRKRGPES